MAIAADLLERTHAFQSCPVEEYDRGAAEPRVRLGCVCMRCGLIPGRRLHFIPFCGPQPPLVVSVPHRLDDWRPGDPPW